MNLLYFFLFVHGNRIVVLNKNRNSLRLYVKYYFKKLRGYTLDKTLLLRIIAKVLKATLILSLFYIIGPIVEEMYRDLRDMIKGYYHSDISYGLAMESFRYYFITATIGYNLLASFLKKKYLRVILFVIAIPAIYFGFITFQSHPYRIIFGVLPVLLISILLPKYIFSKIEFLKNWDKCAE